MGSPANVIVFLYVVRIPPIPHHPSSHKLRRRIRTGLRHSPLFREKHLPSHCLSACLALLALSLLLLAPGKKHSDGLWLTERKPRHTQGVPQNDSALSARQENRLNGWFNTKYTLEYYFFPTSCLSTLFLVVASTGFRLMQFTCNVYISVPLS